MLYNGKRREYGLATDVRFSARKLFDSTHDYKSDIMKIYATLEKLEEI